MTLRKRDKLRERAEKLYKLYTPEGCDHPEGITPIEQALKQTREEALEEAAKESEDECHECRCIDPGACDNHKYIARSIRSLKGKRND